MRFRLLTAAGAAMLLSAFGARAAALDVSGRLPDLRLRMQRADTGAEVTAAAFAGGPVLLYFGYVRCPDACPATLSNLEAVLHRTGPAAAKARVLFVTVDPAHDSQKDLRDFAAAFGPPVVALRPSADMLAATARRYRAAYSATGQGEGERVTHSAAVYLFDAEGRARFILTGLDRGSAPDLEAAERAIRDVANRPR